MPRYRPPQEQTKELVMETYKALYYFELDRAEKITSRTSIIFGLYSLLIAILAFMINDLPKEYHKRFLIDYISMENWIARVHIVLIAFLIIELLLVVNSCKWAKRFLFVRCTKTIKPGFIHKSLYNIDLIKNEFPPIPKRLHMPEKDISPNILAVYIQSAAHHSEENREKDKFYRKTLEWQTRAIVVASLCLGVYFVFKAMHTSTQEPKGIYRYVEQRQQSEGR